MQRCFTTFPDHWPGLGLVIIRLTQGAAIILDAVHAFGHTDVTLGIPASIAELVCGLLLIGGLWTPVVAGATSMIEFALAAASSDGVSAHLMHGILDLAIVMLGPGAWSIDARLFGRRRIDLQASRDR
jgi:putative oxidoreductase